MHAHFTSLSSDSVITALMHDDAFVIAKDEDSVAVPVKVGVEIAAETLRLLLDEDTIRNHRWRSVGRISRI